MKRPRPMRRPWAAAALALALLAADCAHAPPLTRPYPAPSVQTLEATLAARQSAVKGMNARVRATSWLGGQRVRATVNMLVERDGRLRFEAEVSLQGTVATLATNGSTFALLDARKNVLSRGPACPANVASLIRIPLWPAEVAAILLGDAQTPGQGDGAGPASWDPHIGADVLTFGEPRGGTLEIFFRGTDAAREIVGATARGPDGAPLWRTAYEDFETVAGQPLPRTIRFAERSGSFDDGVEIRVRDRTVNWTPPAGAFTLVAPPGVTVRDVGCGPTP